MLHGTLFHPCLTNGHLVWYRNLKCASTYYEWFFREQLGWRPMQFREIEWDRNLVFGHIMEPERRWLKGLAEYFHTFAPFIDILSLTDEQVKSLVYSIPWLDEHSIPYNIALGQYASSIWWLPMDLGNSQQVTYNFLTSQNLSIDYNLFKTDDPVIVHATGDKTRAIFERLRQAKSNLPGKGQYNCLLTEDRLLYSKAVQELNR